jgi:hypothetical protein
MLAEVPNDAAAEKASSAENGDDADTHRENDGQTHFCHLDPNDRAPLGPCSGIGVPLASDQTLTLEAILSANQYG